MATYLGRIETAIEVEVNLSLPCITPEAFIPDITLMGLFTRPVVTNIIRTMLGTIEATSQILLDDKIYLAPETFLYEIINEDIEEEITVWNADKFGHWINNIVIEGNAGITIDSPPTPYYFTPETNKIWALKILADGSANQNSSIRVIWDTGQVNEITIIGSRIIPFPYEVTHSRYNIEHQFQTVLFNNEFFSEQRRPLTRLIKRVTNCEFLFELYQGQHFINKIRKLVNSVLGVGFYTEPMHQIAANLQGLSNISIEETITYYWNMSQAKYIIAINISLNYAEIKEITSYSASSIISDFAFVKSFPKADSVIFPAMLCIMEDRDVEAITDKVAKATIKFKEIFV
jgi:hypothetical protein